MNMNMNKVRSLGASAVVVAVFALAACGDDVSNPEEARRAYLGLDASIEKAIALGFAGFNSAQSANIDAQMTTGTMAGKLVVTGQVDQGTSENKGMRLLTEYTAYSDDGKLNYTTTAGALPMLTMQLKKIPTGTLDGTMVGTLTMAGEIKGSVTLNLAFTGTLQPDPNDMTKVIRKAGTTHITGTATSPAGTYAVDVTR
jgi:hypothetical protein